MRMIYKPDLKMIIPLQFFETDHLFADDQILGVWRPRYDLLNDV